MAEFSAPSFSLGLDLDFDLPVGGAAGLDSLPERPLPGPFGGGSRVTKANAPIREVEKEEDEGEVSFDLPLPPDPVPVFKRLKKGTPSTPRPTPPAVRIGRGSNKGNEGGGRDFPTFDLLNADDDIEDFSSQEDCRMLDAFPRKINPSTRSTSKISLHGCKILTTQSSAKADVLNNSRLSNAPLTQNLESSAKKKMLPKLTISPLRRIQFLDSDSDDSSPCHEVNRNKKVDRSCKEGFSTSHHTAAQENVKGINLGKKPAECLWKDHLTTNSANLATPALDEFCKEYFSTSTNKKTDQASSGGCFPDVSVDCSEGFLNRNASTSEEPYWNVPDPQPPAYRYFFHDDSRIRELVRARLCNFIPLGTPLHLGNQQCDTDTLDYMCQFGSRTASAQTSTRARKTPAKATSNGKRKTNGSVGEPAPSGNWINPRNSMDYPKDAGKRRVCVDNQTSGSGHWYTGQDGRKVYVAKNGQELSGKAAYLHYRKESGARFRKTKKKVAGKKTKAKR